MRGFGRLSLVLNLPNPLTPTLSPAGRGSPRRHCEQRDEEMLKSHYSAATWCRCNSGTTLARSPEGAISAWFSGTAIQFSP